MKKFIALPQELKVLLPNLIKIYLPSFLFIILVWYVSKVFGISVQELTADPAEMLGKPPYTGLISNLGNLLWCGTAAICIFSAFLTKLDPASFRRWFTFLVASSFLTTFLLLDDMFQIHEYYPVLFFGSEANLPQNNKELQNLLEALFYIVYFVCFMLYLFCFKKQIYCTEYLFFALVFFFFGLSVVIDMTPESMPMHYLMEESFKLLGIISWLTYTSKTCSLVIRQLTTNLVEGEQA